jgi:hypothetical protein
MTRSHFRPLTASRWTEPAYQSWRRRAFKRALNAAEVERARPYDLRHSFASLLLYEGRSVIYVARQLGHDARLTLTKYGHVIDELDDAPRRDAETAIRQAREALSEPPQYPSASNVGQLALLLNERSPAVAGLPSSGASRARTGDLLGAIQALSQTEL